MRRSSVLALAALAFVINSCKSTSAPSLPPLTRLAVHELDAHAELRPVGADALSVEHEHEHHGATPARRPATAPVERIAVSMELVLLTPEEAARLTGWSVGDERAFTTPAWDAARVVRRARESEQAEIVAAPRIALFAGERGLLEALDQRAYVRKFVIDYANGAALADPVVDTCTSGVSLEVLGLPLAGGRIELEIELELSELRDPVASYETRVLAHDLPLSIEQPVATFQRLRTKAACGADESLVLVAQSLDGTGRLLFAFLEVARVQDGETRSFGAVR